MAAVHGGTRMGGGRRRRDRHLHCRFLDQRAGASGGDEIAGPLPVRVSLTETGHERFAELLGENCPTGAFEALLTEGGRAAPWEIMAVDPLCTRGAFTLKEEDGSVLFVAAVPTSP